MSPNLDGGVSLLGPYFIKSWVPIGSLFLSSEVPKSFNISASNLCVKYSQHTVCVNEIGFAICSTQFFAHRSCSRGSLSSLPRCSAARRSSTGTLARAWTRWSSLRRSPTWMTWYYLKWEITNVYNICPNFMQKLYIATSGEWIPAVPGGDHWWRGVRRRRGRGRRVWRLGSLSISTNSILIQGYKTEKRMHILQVYLNYISFKYIWTIIPNAQNRL